MTSRDREARARRETNMAGSQPRGKRKRVEGDKEVRDVNKGCISVNIKVRSTTPAMIFHISSYFRTRLTIVPGKGISSVRIRNS